MRGQGRQIAEGYFSKIAFPSFADFSLETPKQAGHLEASPCRSFASFS
jgi:hypothetical protein